MDAVDDAKKYLSLRPPMENKTIFALHPDVLVAGLLDEIERLRNLFDVERSDNIKVRDLLAKANEDMDQFRIDAYRMASLAIDNAKDTERAMRFLVAIREICEVYAGSEEIPQPMTAAEGYLLSLLKETVGIAQEALKEGE